MSAPALLKVEAASKVLTPVWKEKFFVSTTIPLINASASKWVKFKSSDIYSSISVINSQVDEA